MREETPSLRTESTPLFPADEPSAVVTTLHEPSPTPVLKSKHGLSYLSSFYQHNRSNICAGFLNSSASSITPTALPVEIRPFPEAKPTERSKRGRRNSGRTPILTSSSEKNAIAEQAAAIKTPSARTQSKKRIEIEEEDAGQEFDLDVDPLHRSPPSPSKTKRGRSNRRRANLGDFV